MTLNEVLNANIDALRGKVASPDGAHEVGEALKELTRPQVLELEPQLLRVLVSFPEGSAAVEESFNKVMLRADDDDEAVAEQKRKADADKAAADAAVAEQTRLAKEAADNAAADAAARASADRSAAIAAEDAELAKDDIAVERDANGNIAKFIQEYQVVDESSRPIGRRTHLEARSWIDLVRKQRVAHENASRAFARVKEQKLTFQKKQEDQQRNTDAEMATAIQDLNSADPAKKLAAIRKIAASDPEAQKAQREADEVKETWKFRSQHVKDFNPCAANVKLMTDYIRENQLEWTADNLELGFMALESQLAPVELPRTEPAPNPTPVTKVTPVAPVATVPNNPAPVVPVPPVVPPASTPAEVHTPAQPAPVENPPAPAASPRPTFHGGGLVPGETVSGARPLPSAVKLTKREIASWDPATMRKNMQDPEIARQMEALGIKVLKGTWEQIREQRR